MKKKHTAGPLMADPAYKYQDAKGRHFLVGVVKQDLPCGCGVTGGGTLPQPLTVKHCLFHRRALTIMKSAEKGFIFGIDTLGSSSRAIRLRDLSRLQAAMAKAKPKRKKR